MKLLKVCKLIGIKINQGARFLFSYAGCSILLLSLYWSSLLYFPAYRLGTEISCLLITVGQILTTMDLNLRWHFKGYSCGLLTCVVAAIDVGAKAYDEIIETQEKAAAQDGQLSETEQ